MKKLMIVSLVFIAASAHAQKHSTPPDPGQSPDLVLINAAIPVTSSSTRSLQGGEPDAAELLNIESKENSFKYTLTMNKPL